MNVVRNTSCRRTTSVASAPAPLHRARPAAAPPPARCRTTVRLQLVQEPQPLLRERQRQTLGSLDSSPAAALATPPHPQRCFDALAPIPPPSAARTAAQRHLTPKRSRTRDITCVASSECPPNSKKLSCTPTVSTRNTSAQIPASDLFHRSPRRAHTLATIAAAQLHFQCWQRAPVNLAVRRQRQLRQRHDAAGTHVLRQPLPQVLPQLRRRLPHSLLPAPRKPPVACRRFVLAHQHHCFSHLPYAPPAPLRSRPPRCGSHGSSPAHLTDR